VTESDPPEGNSETDPGPPLPEMVMARGRTETEEMIDGMPPLSALGVGSQAEMCRSGPPRDDRPAPAEQNQGNNLHVSGLAKTVTVATLEEVFGKIGKVKSLFPYIRSVGEANIFRSTRLRS
jgi:hypothetical protein